MKPWIQANFDGVKTVSSITTQGRHDADEWVTSYYVSYADSSGWRDITHPTGSTLTFTANTDSNTAVTNSIPGEIVATSVVLWPITWNAHVSLRFLVQGCDYASTSNS